MKVLGERARWAGIAVCASLAVCGGSRVGVAPETALTQAARPVGPPRAAVGDDETPPPELEPPALAPIEDARLAAIDKLVDETLAEGKAPGCVVVVGRRDSVLYRKAHGFRALAPDPEEMTLDTVFDVASMTKPLATAASLMVLAERGAIALDDPVARTIPEFAKNGKGSITLRHLLTHTSGLPAETPMRDFHVGPENALAKIYDLAPRRPPGAAFAYSDVGFIVLGEVVRRASGADLATFAAENVFEPLGMHETSFVPGPDMARRAAVTEQRDGEWIRGAVHDPRAHLLGGVAGHAGLFSTAEDLTRFAQAMLAEGRGADHHVFSPRTAMQFFAPHDVPGAVRALGWDVQSAYSGNRGQGLSRRAFGHGGYTGTVLWIDPELDFFFLLLSNRVHPDGKGSVNPLAGRIGTTVASALVPAPTPTWCTSGKDVETGIDVLRAERFERLRGRKIGLLTNVSGRAKDGASTIDLLRRAPGVDLVALFGPEHGLGADREGRIRDGKDPRSGLPVYSLFGASRAQGGDGFGPSAESLAGIDTLVVDLQDVGVRFYTYASTLRRLMEVAAERHLRIVVLDRPNPIGGVDVSGPVLVPGARSLVNHFPLPVRHGMTMGELAQLFNAGAHLGVPLEVVRMRGWRRGDYYDATGLTWVPPSPNLRKVEETVLYPAVGLLEGTNLSVGRGTDSPFEVVGAPFIDAAALTATLRASGIAGVTFAPAHFTPRETIYAKQRCGGVRVTVTNRDLFEPVRTGLAMAAALRALYPREWNFADLNKLVADRRVLDAIDAKRPLSEIEGLWADDLRVFRARREKYLLYPVDPCATPR